MPPAPPKNSFATPAIVKGTDAVHSAIHSNLPHGALCTDTSTDRHTIREPTLSVSNLLFYSLSSTDRHTIPQATLSVSARVHFNKFRKSSESLQNAHRVLQKIDLSIHKATVCCLVLRICALTRSDKIRSSAMQSGLERVIATPAVFVCVHRTAVLCVSHLVLPAISLLLSSFRTARPHPWASRSLGVALRRPVAKPEKAPGRCSL